MAGGSCCNCTGRSELGNKSGSSEGRRRPEMNSKVLEQDAPIPQGQLTEKFADEELEAYPPPNMAGGTRTMEINKSRSGSMPGRYAGSREAYLNPRPPYQEVSTPDTPTPDKESSKKWTFGNLFRRKDKNSSGLKNPSVPITIQFEPSQRGTTAGSSEDIESSDAEPKHQNFLSRKLSSRRGKKAKKGLLKVPGPSSELGCNGRVQSWESTKKIPPPMVLNGTHTYSSSGSLSRSLEGSSPLSRGSRAAARDATKARAEARRQSYLVESSSEEEAGSYQGSHSSIASRNRHEASLPPNRLTPVAVSNSSPNLVGQTAGPRWEARVVYTKETHGTPEPFVVKLPRNQFWSNSGTPHSIRATESFAEDTQVITAGLRVPFAIRSPVEEPVYANLPSHGTPPPPPQRDFTRTTSSPNPQFYRPVSCSYLDSYRDPNESAAVVPNPRKSHYQDNRNNNGWYSPSIQPYEHEAPRYTSTPTPTAPQVKVQTVVQNGSLKQQPWNQKETQPVTSKLGYPVRKLNESNVASSNVPVARSPVHVRASEFWRRKEEETGRNGIKSPTSPSRQNRPELGLSADQRRALSRIRSADSSPLPLPKASGNPAGLLRSNESISSLSSFSAETPSPHFFSKRPSSRIHPGPLQVRNIKSPDFKISTTPTCTKEEPKSAVERLNVRFSSTTPSPSPTTPAAPSIISSTSSKSGKSPGKNLEDALNELEVMYKSLRLSDEDLLDRAERRDLPTAHQELWDKEPIQPRYRYTPVGSMESIATDSTDGSRRPRVRAPPLRRSSRPDPIQDDMAVRKYESKVVTKPNDPREVVSQTGSYLMLSPAFSPPVSPEPSGYIHNYKDPDITMDDVTVRNYKRANSIRLIEEPQPLFGIPLGPLTTASDSDYLHSRPVERYRPLFRHVKNPDLVKDDVAFRSLRKDLSQENNLSKDWTPRLFSPMESGSGSSENIFNYNIQPESQNKKLRAIRSLSANITHLVSPFTPSSPVNEEIGKWNSLADLNSNRNSRSLTPARASTYLEPSWVEQANLEEFQGFGTSDSPPSPIIRKTKDIVKPKQTKAKVNKTSLPPVPVDPNKPRRPWTDILLESFEKEKLREQELAEAEGEDALTDDEVFLDASSATPRVSPIVPSSKTEESGAERRGSYVESDPTSGKRSSWSDQPKQFETLTSAYEAIAAPTSKKIQFTPLPPPRRLKSIIFSTSEPPQLVHEIIETKSAPTTFEEQTSIPSPPTATPRASSNELSVLPSSSHDDSSVSPPPSRGEQELNELIDALVREADNCGPSDSPKPADPEVTPRRRKSRPSRPSSAEKESKWQAAIAEMESLSHPPASPPSNKMAEIADDPVDDLEEKPIEYEWVRTVISPAGPSIRASTASTSTTTTLEPDGDLVGQDQERPNTSSHEAKSDHWSAMNSEPEVAAKRSSSTKEESESKNRKSGSSSTFDDPKSKKSSGQDPERKLEGNVTKRVGGIGPFVKPFLSTGTSSAFTPIKLKPFGFSGNNQEMGVKRYQPLAPSASESAITAPQKALRSAQLKTIQKNWDNEKQNSVKNNNRIRNSFDQLKKSESSSPETSKELHRYVREEAKSSSEDGMIGLRRLLRKENTPIPSVMPKTEDKFGVKKSSSGVIGNSYWSRISANQPSFLRKFFEKKSPSNSTPLPVPEPEKPIEPEAEPFVALNVAEKASHFMKLEQDQRYSKWRNNANNKKEERSKSSRYSTQPVTTLEVQTAAKVKVRTDTPNVSVSESLNASVKKAGNIEVSVASAQVQPGTKSSSAEFDDASSENQLEPSSLSLKDRVHMFNRLSRISINSPPSTPLISSSAPNSRDSRNGKPDILLRRHLSRSEIESSYEDLTLVLPLDQKPNNINSKIKTWSSPIPFIRNARVQSMYAQALEPSEDENSSGGQEVAEIISRSYENSPIVRKKSWRSLKSTPAALFKDAKGGKWEDNISHWSTATDFSMRMTDGKQNSNFPKVPIPVVRSLPTTTSNLLPILTALSSSDDQLSDAKPLRRNAERLRKLNGDNSSSEVHVPNPDDESFRTFFRNKPGSPGQRGTTLDADGESSGVLLQDSTEDLNLGWVERDEDLLVNMKRQLPRRRSSRGKSKNPLKVLAARIDFKNQKYTETLQ